MNPVVPTNNGHTTKQDELLAPVWKVLVCGESQVGKTTLITTYHQRTFVPTLTPTQGIHLHTLAVKGQPFQLFDLSGQLPLYDLALVHQYAHQSDLALCCFDINDEATLEALPKWIGLLPSRLPRLLVALKMDLFPYVTPLGNYLLYIQDYQEVFGFYSLHFVSSKDLTSMTRLFSQVLHLLQQPERLVSHRAKV